MTFKVNNLIFIRIIVESYIKDKYKKSLFDYFEVTITVGA